MIETIFTDANHWAVFFAAIAYMIIGAVWYSPFLLGKRWMKEAGLTRDKMASYSNALAGSFVAAILMGYVLAYVIAISHSTTAYYGALIGFWSWLGFVATTKILDVLYSGKSWTLFAIESGYLLVSLIAMGAIIGSY